MQRNILTHFVALSCAALLVTAVLSWLLAQGVSLDQTNPALAGLIIGLFAINTGLLVFSVLTALLGLQGHVSELIVSKGQAPAPGRCAVLWLVCGEPPELLATRLGDFLNDLTRNGQQAECDVFVLSDTQGQDALALEQRALAPLMDRVTYRNRETPKGRKPGNVQDWLVRHGAAYESMLLLDADSGFSAGRLGRMRARMARDARLGLIQAAIRLRPGTSRFGRMQRLSARLSGPVFAQGLARLSGTSGNFWGHNALIRVQAFAEVTPLPDLPGRPPLGGPVLSHDFVEAALMRARGWQLIIDPDSRGSFEDAPETIAAYMRRDRRWAQGNLQHLRLLAKSGLHPLSRFHLSLGILSYLSAPIWLLLVLLTGSGAVHVTADASWTVIAVLALLFAPKFAGAMSRGRAWRHRARRRVLIRSMFAEIGLTTIFAPLGMMRRTGFVSAILAGRNAGWVPSGQAVRAVGPHGRGETLAGVALIAAVTLPQALIAGTSPALLAALLIQPVALPLLAAPLVWRWFDAERGARNAVARYYDTSTRRFLRVGGSGAALAIHRPLWAEGVRTPAMAAMHVNTLIQRAAEQALGGPPRRVTDLGCGVGGTLLHLAQVWPDAQFCGITISGAQVQLAQGHAEARGLGGRCQFLRSDFTLPMTLARADLVIAVESHVHAPDAATFLRAAHRHLQSGGVLILVDDMLARPEAELDARAAHRLAQFRRGWRLGHVPDLAGLAEKAANTGFALEGVQDLTDMLRLDRLRDKVLRLAGPVADRAGLARVPFFGNMIGGNALTESYRAGQMRYRLVVLRQTQSGQMLKPATQEAVA
jgi:membrane glycosyltransferase/SAM-dependent methyltransferase